MVKEDKRNQKGFTLVELLLSMAVFSFVLGISVTVFVQINRLYYRGISISRAQQTARNVVDEIKVGLQVSNFESVNYVPIPASDLITTTLSPARANIPQRFFCVGDNVYYYKLAVRARDLPASPPANANLGGRHVLSRWVSPGFCNAAPDRNTFSVPPTAADLVDEDTMIHQFDVTSNTIRLVISYGDFDQLEPTSINVSPTNTWTSPDVRCRGGVDVVFCGVSKLEAEVVRRTR